MLLRIIYRQIKEKRDDNTEEWLADLLRHGLIKGSIISKYLRIVGSSNVVRFIKITFPQLL